MKKSELRKKYLKLRRALSKDEVLLFSEKIFKNFNLQFKVSENQNVHIFLPIDKLNEVNTKIFVDFLWERKVNVFVPKMKGDQLISIKLTPDTALKANAWGIEEPTKDFNEANHFDWVITPMVYCDKNGNRIGYGKGFYDQFFNTINADALKIGVNFFSPNEEIEDVWEADVRMDYLVTPFEILSFGRTSISTK